MLHCKSREYNLTQISLIDLIIYFLLFTYIHWYLAEWKQYIVLHSNGGVTVFIVWCTEVIHSSQLLFSTFRFNVRIIVMTFSTYGFYHCWTWFCIFEIFLSLESMARVYEWLVNTWHQIKPTKLLNVFEMKVCYFKNETQLFLKYVKAW